MMAAVVMMFDGDPTEYIYGVYPFNTSADKDKVNVIAKRLRTERGCDIRIDRKKGDI